MPNKIFIWYIPIINDFIVQLWQSLVNLNLGGVKSWNPSILQYSVTFHLLAPVSRYRWKLRLIFLISGQCLIKRNYYYSRTSNDIDFDFTREIQQHQKKIDNDIMLANCNVIVIFLIEGQFGVMWKPDSGCMVCKTYIFINNNLLS